MMSTDLKERAEQIIANICGLLDESVLQQKINEPITRAVNAFQHKEEFPISHKAFHRIIGDFTRHIYESGLKTPWKMSLAGPGATAISLLEDHYQGTYATGYAAARRDAIDPDQQGIDLVLHRLAESIKTIEREQYTHWIFARYLQPVDWELRCMIAWILLDRYQEFLPFQVCQCRPAQLADQIPSIILCLLVSDMTMHQLALYPQKQSPC